MTPEKFIMRPQSGMWPVMTLATFGIVLGALSISACSTNDILEQASPSTFQSENLNNPNSAQLLVNSAVAELECTLAQYTISTGLVSDEIIDAQLGALGWDYDRRTVTSASVPPATNTCATGTQAVGHYTPLSTARFSGDDAARRLEGWTDAQVSNRQTLLGVAVAHAAYAVVMLGESMCSAAIDGGPELTPTQLFTEAETRFTKAITAATAANDSSTLNLARVGRARARLDLKNYTGAKSDAQLVPIDFVRNATYSTSQIRRENRVYAHFWRDNFSSVDPSFRNLTFNGVADPRVGVVNRNVVGHDLTTPVWAPNKYSAINAPIPIASGKEAQLIIAEASLNGAGTQQDAIAVINALHAKAGLPSYDPAAAGAKTVLNQLIEERSRELFLEGHRLWDLIRFQLPLNPAAGASYPPKAGGSYGNQLCFPLPDVERNNNPTLRGS
jgi:hypothetical protein